MNGFNHAPEDSDWDHDHIQYDLRPYDHRKEIEILPQVDKFSRELYFANFADFGFFCEI